MPPKRGLNTFKYKPSKGFFPYSFLGNHVRFIDIKQECIFPAKFENILTSLITVLL